MLTFTVCRTTEFSCDDGQCIPIVLRCNDVINCRDSSDEKNCNVYVTGLPLDITDEEFEALLDDLHGKGQFGGSEDAAPAAAPARPLKM